MHLVGAGLAVAALSKTLVSEDLEEIRLALIPVEGWPLKRKLHVIHHSRKYVSRPIATFLDHFQFIAQGNQCKSEAR